MRIQELESKTGLERATIRFYEKEGLLNPARQENGYRDYSLEDCDNLLKIKLLRHLGMNLDKIKILQQGREDFGQAMDEQIRILGQKEASISRAKEVCKEIRTSQTDYVHLNAPYYLEMLSRPSGTAMTPKPIFCETVWREVHPVRRFVARELDKILLDALILFFLIVVLRVRPATNIPVRLLSLAVPWLLVPVEALLWHFWGTTPGKWVMGIRIDASNGGRLSFGAAIRRAWGVLHYGCGWNIPIWHLWRMYKSYQQHMETADLDWDDESEIVYADWNLWRKAAALILAGICFGLTVVTTNDMLLPKHRGADLTIAEFSENFNDYYQQLSDSSENLFLSSDGIWEYISYYTYDGYESSEHVKANFRYETENGVLKSITMDDEWRDDFFTQSAIPQYCTIAGIAVVGAQPGMSYNKLRNFINDFNNSWLETLESGENAGEVIFENVRVSWELELEYCVIGVGGVVLGAPGEGIDEIPHMRVHFSVELLQ